MPEPASATLKDVTTPNPSVAADTKEPAQAVDAAAAAAAAASKVADAEAIEIGRVLLESGYTKSQVSDLLQTPQALQTMRYLIENNPNEFLQLLERSNPTTGEKFLESMADTYIKRYHDKGAAPGTGDGKDAAAKPGAELMAEVEALREKIGSFETREQQRNAAAATAQVKARYEARVDDLFKALPTGVELNKADAKALRAQLNQELAEDPSMVQRISNGNFVDVPRRFQSIIENWASEKKSAATADATKRKRSEDGSFSEILGGPNPLVQDIPADVFNSWDSTEEAFGKALERASR